MDRVYTDVAWQLIDQIRYNIDPKETNQSSLDNIKN
jgi:hypothetical protein